MTGDAITFWHSFPTLILYQFILPYLDGYSVARLSCCSRTFSQAILLAARLWELIVLKEYGAFVEFQTFLPPSLSNVSSTSQYWKAVYAFLSQDITVGPRLRNARLCHNRLFTYGAAKEPVVRPLLQLLSCRCTARNDHCSCQQRTVAKDSWQLLPPIFCGACQKPRLSAGDSSYCIQDNMLDFLRKEAEPALLAEVTNRLPFKTTDRHKPTQLSSSAKWPISSPIWSPAHTSDASSKCVNNTKNGRSPWAKPSLYQNRQYWSVSERSRVPQHWAPTSNGIIPVSDRVPEIRILFIAVGDFVFGECVTKRLAKRVVLGSLSSQILFFHNSTNMDKKAYERLLECQESLSLWCIVGKRVSQAQRARRGFVPFANRQLPAFFSDETSLQHTMRQVKRVAEATWDSDELESDSKRRFSTVTRAFEAFPVYSCVREGLGGVMLPAAVFCDPLCLHTGTRSVDCLDFCAAIPDYSLKEKCSGGFYNYKMRIDRLHFSNAFTDASVSTAEPLGSSAVSFPAWHCLKKKFQNVEIIFDEKSDLDTLYNSSAANITPVNSSRTKYGGVAINFSGYRPMQPPSWIAFCLSIYSIDFMAAVKKQPKRIQQLFAEDFLGIVETMIVGPPMKKGAAEAADSLQSIAAGLPITTAISNTEDCNFGESHDVSKRRAAGKTDKTRIPGPMRANCTPELSIYLSIGLVPEVVGDLRGYDPLNPSTGAYASVFRRMNRAVIREGSVVFESLTPAPGHVSMAYNGDVTLSGSVLDRLRFAVSLIDKFGRCILNLACGLPEVVWLRKEPGVMLEPAGQMPHVLVYAEGVPIIQNVNPEQRRFTHRSLSEDSVNEPGLPRINILSLELQKKFDPGIDRIKNKGSTSTTPSRYNERDLVLTRLKLTVDEQFLRRNAGLTTEEFAALFAALDHSNNGRATSETNSDAALLEEVTINDRFPASRASSFSGDFDDDDDVQMALLMDAMSEDVLQTTEEYFRSTLSRQRDALAQPLRLRSREDLLPAVLEESSSNVSRSLSTDSRQENAFGTGSELSTDVDSGNWMRPADSLVSPTHKELLRGTY